MREVRLKRQHILSEDFLSSTSDLPNFIYAMSNRGAYLIAKQAIPLEVKTSEISKPGTGEILIKNKSIAFNPVDWKVQDGGFLVDKFPAIIGGDAAGTIEAVGEDVKGFKTGDRVFSFTPSYSTQEPKHGAFQEYTIAYALASAHIPESVSLDSAATIGLGAATAAQGLFHKDFLNLPRPSGSTDLPKKTGIDVLVWGGASSVGQYAIQLASQAGNTVYTTASPKHHDKLIALGAAQVFDYNSSTVVEDIKKTAPKLSLVYDSISEGPTVQQSVEVLQNGGIIALTLPPQIDIPTNVQAKPVFATKLHTDDKELGSWLFNEYLETALQSGRFVPNDVAKRPDGIDGIQAVLTEYKTKGIRGAKFVINP